MFVGHPPGLHLDSGWSPGEPCGVPGLRVLEINYFNYLHQSRWTPGGVHLDSVLFIYSFGTGGPRLAKSGKCGSNAATTISVPTTTIPTTVAAVVDPPGECPR